jgi:hypothetical protein
VEATDVRPEVKEQVASLGAKYIEPPGTAVGEGGYAAEQSEDFLKRQQETVHKHLVAADVVITTAKIPGKKAPLLVSEDVVREMRTGSVIVDLAAEEGGNCELTEPGEIVEKYGVTKRLQRREAALPEGGEAGSELRGRDQRRRGDPLRRGLPLGGDPRGPRLPGPRARVADRPPSIRSGLSERTNQRASTLQPPALKPNRGHRSCFHRFSSHSTSSCSRSSLGVSC